MARGRRRDRSDCRELRLAGEATPVDEVPAPGRDAGRPRTRARRVDRHVRTTVLAASGSSSPAVVRGPLVAGRAGASPHAGTRHPDRAAHPGRLRAKARPYAITRAGTIICDAIHTARRVASARREVPCRAAAPDALTPEQYVERAAEGFEVLSCLTDRELAEFQTRYLPALVPSRPARAGREGSRCGGRAAGRGRAHPLPAACLPHRLDGGTRATSGHPAPRE